MAKVWGFIQGFGFWESAPENKAEGCPENGSQFLLGITTQGQDTAKIDSWEGARADVL